MKIFVIIKCLIQLLCCILTFCLNRIQIFYCQLILVPIFLLIILVVEFILIVFKVNFDLSAFFGQESKYVAGYYLPMGDIKIFGPILAAILSVVLFFRTAGVYTKWLSVIICVGSLTAVYIMNPVFFQSILKIIINKTYRRTREICRKVEETRI